MSQSFASCPEQDLLVKPSCLKETMVISVVSG